MAKFSNTELSIFVNDAMDYDGYSKESISLRAALLQRAWEDMNDSYRREDVPFEMIAAGSRSEGVVKIFESDLDLMFVFRNFLCVDTGRTENDITIIETHMTESPPGYTKLNPLDMNAEIVGSNVLASSTVYDLQEGRVWLLSSGVIKAFAKLGHVRNDIHDHVILRQRSGPSLPATRILDLGAMFRVPFHCIVEMERDRVFTMPYLSTTILETWKKRYRKHEWPSREVIQEISTMEGFVVPVGPNYSEEQNFEWRICFTTAEQKLVSSFNPVQLKLYVLLKKIFKEIVSPECDLITSYMVKNIVFWFCEGNDLKKFTRENLIHLLLQALAFLLQCLYSNFLPNYMIQSRNLLYGKGNPQDKIILRRILRNLLNEGGLVVLRLRKISTLTYVTMRSPADAKLYGDWRNKTENFFIKFTHLCDKNPIFERLREESSGITEFIYEVMKDPELLEACLSFSEMNIHYHDVSQIQRDPWSAASCVMSVFS